MRIAMRAITIITIRNPPYAKNVMNFYIPICFVSTFSLLHSGFLLPFRPPSFGFKHPKADNSPYDCPKKGRYPKFYLRIAARPSPSLTSRNNWTYFWTRLLSYLAVWGFSLRRKAFRKELDSLFIDFISYSSPLFGLIDIPCWFEIRNNICYSPFGNPY